MTLLIAGSNPRFGVIFSDCRVSSNGKALDEDHSKIAQLQLANARLLYAYTGLAHNADKTFQTDIWLAKTINKKLQIGMTAEQALTVLRNEASECFRSPIIKAMPKSDQRLSVVFAGFDGDKPFLAMISNFDCPDEQQYDFKDEFLSWGLTNRAVDDAHVIATGNTNSLKKDDLGPLSRMIYEDKSLEAITAKARSIILKAADDPRSAGTIGSNMLHGVVPADKNQSSQSAYISKNGSEWYPVISVLTPQSPLAIAAFKLHLVSPSPSRPHRNTPCPCGSGRKFKRCHGRTS